MANEFVITIVAGEWNYPSTDPAPLDTDTGGNGSLLRQLFDDSTEEYVLQQRQVPSSLDESGTVLFELYGYASTVDGAEVQFRFSHSAKAKGEDWDAAYADVQSGDYVTDAQQDELDFIEWSASVAALGWAASDHLRIMLSRSAVDSGSTVSGDYGVAHFRIRIPVE